MAQVIGNENDNFLFGTSAPDEVYGVGGIDNILAQASDDLVDGGTGNDFVDGGSGNDRILGGAGNDTLYANEGDDLVDGGNDNDLLLGWSGNDTLLGGSGDDVLDGQAGFDVLIGGVGNDTYVLADRADRIFEAPNSGSDTVQATFAIRLPRDIENLTLLGDRPLTARGSSGSNVLRGNNARNRLFGLGGNDRLLGLGGNDTLVGDEGNDDLYGGAGRDRLTGSAGRDRFCFDGRRKGRDRITDFSVSNDTIGVSRAAFGRNLRRDKAIASDQFHLGSGASDRSDRFIYDSNRGALYFDPDGAGGLRQVELARLGSGLNLTHRHIVGIP